MSQKKVEQYKYEKSHRKEIMRKQKMMHGVRSAIMGIVAIALVGWLGYSAYGVYLDGQPRQEVEVDYSAFDGYLQTLTMTTAE